jgi:hypothetical protein
VQVSGRWCACGKSLSMCEWTVWLWLPGSAQDDGCLVQCVALLGGVSLASEGCRVGGFAGLGVTVAEVLPVTHPLALVGDAGLQRYQGTWRRVLAGLARELFVLAQLFAMGR